MNIAAFNQKIRSNEGNCLIYGCASLVVLGIIGVVIIGYGANRFYNKILDYTDETAMDLPVVEISDSERDAIIDRFDAWSEAMGDDDGEKTTLSLTEQDINVLIQYHEDMEQISNVVYITINDSIVTGQVSFPLDEIPGFSGRYFNGSADFEIELENGRLYLYTTAASVKGESIPDEVMQQMRNENLAKDLDDNPDTRELIEKIESIEVKDGVVTIVPVDAIDAVDTEEQDNEAA